MSRLLVAQRALTAPGWITDDLWRRARAVPSLDLRFADSKSLVDAVTGASLVTFTRAGSGTFTNSAGVLQTAATDVPRFDHNPITGESLGLLVEESRTNLLLRSEEFGTSWARFGTTTLTENTSVAPNGTTTGDNIVFTSATSGIFQANPGSASTTYVFSIWIKSSASTQVRVVINTNLSDPVIQTVTVTSQWQRFSVTKTTSVGTTSVTAQVQDNGSGSTQFDLWGAQLEANAFPTSYIPTTTAAATRSASLGDLISSAIANNIRSFYVEFSSPAVGTRGVVSLNDNTANERINALTSGTDPRLVVQDGGVEQANINGGTVAAGAKTRVAVRINTDDFAISINGGTVVTDTSGTLPTVDRLMLGRTQAGEYLNGRIARFTGWSQLLPNATLQTLAQ